ncbi:MAG: DUF5017 domain-containing protein [Bacteroidales bacterium]|nr:DUF5017 domain-containing protein [Bacteroidales bacterium]MCF8334795.1 DUF5017 domain-containing protein [Bacteroidales bacterium]
MKVLKYLFLITIFIGVATSCNYYDDAYDDLDDADNVHVNQEPLQITLSEDDYEAISNLGQKNATNLTDSARAAKLMEMGFFTDSVSAADLVPFMLKDRFPEYGPTSSAKVTFKYNGEMPENLSKYTEAAQYSVRDSDYDSLTFELGVTNYFFPDQPAKWYIPDILDYKTDLPREGQLAIVSYEKSDVNPNIDTTTIQDQAIFEEDFDEESDGLGQFTDFNAEGDTSWHWGSYSGTTYAKITGYAGEPMPNENWLISPEIDLSGHEDITLEFRHAINYLNDQYDQVSVHITTDLNTSDTAATQWTELEVPNMTSGDSWDFVNSGEIDLSDYAGEKVNIAFKYVSSSDNAATWEVDNVTVSVPGSISVTGDEPYDVTTIYKYDGDNWIIDQDSYYLNEKDYDAMGLPGEYDNFEGEQPKNYLPEFMDYKYPVGDESISKTLVYEYFTGSDVIMLASTYTMKNGSWTGSYNYIQEKTQQFVVTNSRGNWLFNPNVTFRMVSKDYQIIVDAVAEEYGDQFIDDYGTGEYYTGANSYYENFDLRIDQRVEYDPENFEGLSTEEAKDKIIQRLTIAMQLLLENKYPDAVPEQNGIPVHYYVTFESYNNDFSRSTWKADMLCTSAGDPPQFELVDNTFIRDGEELVVPSGN